jgi:DNA-binding beta-propeller fold protein YncE
MTTVGSTPFTYQPAPHWEQLPRGWSFVEAVGVAVDSHDRVFVFNRGEHPVMVFDADGRFLTSWGEGQFVRPHGICIGPDDCVYLTDDQDHTVRKFTPEGRLLLTLGVRGRPSETGMGGGDFPDYRAIRASAEPFNLPTNLALGAGGEMYVADGYGNARVHKFSPAGELLRSWGEPGEGPGQFNIPHGIGVDRNGRVIVADRENSRLQFFSPDGELLEEWTDVVRPCDVFIDAGGSVYVAELGRRAGLFPFMAADSQAVGGRVSIFDSRGRLQARWGGGADPMAPHDFFAPHDIWVDSAGSVYVGEVTWSAGGKRGMVPADCPTLRKFVRT